METVVLPWFLALTLPWCFFSLQTFFPHLQGMPYLSHNFIAQHQYHLERNIVGVKEGELVPKSQVDLFVHGEGFPGLSSPSFLVLSSHHHLTHHHRGPAAVLLGDSSGDQQALYLLAFPIHVKAGGKCSSVLVIV